MLVGRLGLDPGAELRSLAVNPGNGGRLVPESPLVNFPPLGLYKKRQ
jgi:hypothetical protein